jgi:hypothetical protein
MEASNNQAPPVGYQPQDYEIRKVLSVGGFSFVYVAHDKDQKSYRHAFDATTTIIDSVTYQQTIRKDNSDESARTAKDLTDNEIVKTSLNMALT